MAKRNSVKEWLESSPWTLGAGALAALLTFVITVADKGLALYEKWNAPPQIAAIEIAHIGGYMMVRPSGEMAKIPAIKAALALDEEIPKMFEGARPPTAQVPLWPVQLLVLNSLREKVSLHSCKMTVRLPSAKFPALSSEYFVSDTVPFSSQVTGRPFMVEPARADRVTLIFLFPGLDATTFTEPKFFETPAVADVACYDQAKRELRATANMYHPLRPGQETRTILRPLS